jgi:hypothetical protein
VGQVFGSVAVRFPLTSAWLNSSPPIVGEANPPEARSALHFLRWRDLPRWPFFGIHESKKGMKVAFGMKNASIHSVTVDKTLKS